MSLYLFLILFSVCLSLVGAVFILILQETAEEEEEEELAEVRAPRSRRKV